VKRSTREHVGAEYDSHRVIIERHSSCRDKYCYTSCEHVYSDRHSHSYNEYFTGGSCDLPQSGMQSCHSKLSKRMVNLHFSAAFF
jgi:hypothetical protein